jgi:NADP-dependent 3-hydroxy acid dehydrogenase YdfG
MGNDVVVVTGASSGFGRLGAEALALAGHTVYASMRDTWAATHLRSRRSAPSRRTMASTYGL